jgi:hypothetical protein
MKQLLLVLCLAAFAVTPQLKAQTCDPWIVKAYDQLYGRTATAEECKIANYNGGKWNSYVELVGHIATYNRNRAGNHLKGDPWIFMAYVELYNRAPYAFELNIKLYNNGSWNNYEELKKYVGETQASLQKAGAVVKQVTDGLGNFLNIIQRATKIAMSVVSNSGDVKAKGGKAALEAVYEAIRKAAKSKGIEIKGTESGFAPSAKYVTLSGKQEVLATSGNGGILFEN